MNFFDDIRETINKAAQSVSNMTKENAEISRISGEIKNIIVEVESLLTQIGQTYVSSKGQDTENLCALCARVEELRARQSELEKQKLLVRNQNVCPGCGSVMPKDFRFCSNCGMKMPEPETTEEKPAEEPVEEVVIEAEAEVAAEAVPEAEDVPEVDAEETEGE